MKTQPHDTAEVIDLVPQILHLKKILVPTDFSPASEQAFKYAIKFAEQFDAELTVIHVLTPSPPSAADLAGVPAFSDHELDKAEKDLRDLVGRAREAGVASSHSTFRVGLAPHEIVETAKELDVDLIVIATHGYTGWRHLCIGSTAERVVRAAPCPVFVVREKEHEFI
jgi:nucleotide-binding universal stress UspA family protein